MLKAFAALLLLVLLLMVLIGGAGIGAAITTTGGTSPNGCGEIVGGCIYDGAAAAKRIVGLEPGQASWWPAPTPIR